MEPPVHATSGCDTVASSYGIGKLKAIATSKKGLDFDSLCVIDAPWDDVEKEVTHFMVTAYGGLGVTMSEYRKRLWAQKTAKPCDVLKLCSLPQTTEAFNQNIRRAHFEDAQWYAALDPDPPPLNPREYGWEADDINKSHSATTVAQGVCWLQITCWSSYIMAVTQNLHARVGAVGAQVAKSHVQ